MQKAIHGITVAHFFETYRENLKMELVTGQEGLHRLIHEGSINRPSLALTGFFKYFAHPFKIRAGITQCRLIKLNRCIDIDGSQFFG